MDDFRDLAGVFACITLSCFVVAGVLIGIDYIVSAEPTVNAINQQCGTSYVPSDYLRIGPTTMLQMCETREKRIELKQ